jgi:peptidoglycan hydrolase-like protein with peptidoglycan-binding domain
MHYKTQQKNKNIQFAVIAFLALFAFALPSITHAASLYFGPSSGSYRVGQQFNVKVLVSSTDQRMNAAGARISFSTKDLELVSISESSSLIDVWGEAPFFSNSTGRASFEGLILDGYQGSRGEIATLIFRAKSPGKTTLRFSSGSVLAYNGLGSSILKNLGDANFTITAAPAFEIPTKIPDEFEFTKDMRSEDENIEVAYLQLCLTSEDVYGDDITGYFGTKTKQAVIDFQEKYFDEILAPDGFTRGTGLVGEHTRKKLNEICLPEITEQLFDIAVRLESTDVVQASDLEAVITFESFGKGPTPVDIAYTIVNKEGQIVFKDAETLAVETEEIVRKQFHSLNLLPGGYTLVSSMKYNVDVIDEFRNDFVVEEAEEAGVFVNLSLLVWLLILCVVIIILLSITNILFYLQYDALKKKKSKSLNKQTIEKHLLQDKRLQKELEIGESLIQNLKEKLLDVEVRLKQVSQEIRERSNKFNKPDKPKKK